MRPVVIVIGTLSRQHGAGVRERAEQGLIEQLVPQPAREALGTDVLHRFAQRDVVRFDLTVVSPPRDRVRAQCRCR